MLDTSGLSTKFLKKENYCGSYSGMRYMIKKGEEGITAYIYSEPWAFEMTPEEERLSKKFPFSDDGVAEVIAWLTEIHDSNRKFWDNASKSKMANMLTGKHLGVPK